ncbi:hypothetical protein H4R19_003305 [Coemansia spiralis]|nr:hypothetical protein H4R19_003305 [Coemansia spiralis]
MAALTGKELDDSIFGNDAHLDWADEVMTDPLFDDPLKGGGADKHDEGVGSMGTSPPSQQGSSRRGRDSRGRNNQGVDRQSRQGARADRNSSSGPPPRSPSRGGMRTRNGRSSSRTGAGAPQLPQLPQHPVPVQIAGGARHGRGPRDRSMSVERESSVDQMRSWRGPSSGGRSRADMASVWEHDKFSTSHPQTAAPAGAGRASERRNSVSAGSATAVGIEHTGKEGDSHVAIARRESSASVRGATSPRHDQQQQPQHTIVSPDARNGSQDAAKPSLASPRAQLGPEPYRAPHRRQSSADGHPAPSPESAPQSAKKAAPTTPPAKPTVRKVSGDRSSTAESEWENFVANGGLDIPFEHITDELLKHPRKPLLQPQPPQQPPKAQRDISTPSPVAKDHPPPTLGDRTTQLLNNDRDDEVEIGSRSGGKTRKGASGSKTGDHGPAARSSTKKAPAAGPAARADAGTTSPMSAGQTPASQTPGPRSKKQQTSGKSGDAVGIQIKGAAAVAAAANGQKRGNARAPTQPAKPAAPAEPSRSPTPTKPSTPPLSRSSSGEGRPAQQGTVPSSYLRRQHEGYDEDRGHHVFSVNIPYGELRYAPIHVHERDDLTKLAAKFARTWRVHNKELRIRRMLVKMKAVMLEDPL